jgi:hypothetical protein
MPGSEDKKEMFLHRSAMTTDTRKTNQAVW